MKCAHTNCNNEAEADGYCKACVKMPSHECNHCNEKKKSIFPLVIGAIGIIFIVLTAVMLLL